MTRYLPSKQYQYAGVAALVLALVCACFAVSWPLAWIPTGLFLATGGLMLLLSLLPAIEVHATHLAIGNRLIGWEEIRRVDRTGFVSPLVVKLTLANDRCALLVYPGGLESSNSLLRHLRRMAREALLDGIPYRQFWGEATPSGSDRRAMPSPKYQVVRAEDEVEIERMLQRLKTVGHLDRTDEK
ncbi:MAG: hypothetical protein HY235_24920 [Acidobacteria bacterium]|nr:hypothetical protein [Acidobacteriota bacterium]